MLSQVLTRREQLVLTFVAGSILVGSIVLYTSNSSSSTEPFQTRPAVSQAAPQPLLTDPAPVSEPAEIVTEAIASDLTLVVSVAGAVRSPGVYTLSLDSRVQDAIDEAGGVAEDADLADINLAARLIDGTTLTIPGEPASESTRLGIIRRPEAEVTTSNPAAYTLSGWQPQGSVQSLAGQPAVGGPSSGRIDLNRASSAELQMLPGIGPKLANEIIRFREQQRFGSVDDLDLVSGIGPKRLDAIRGLVTVNP
jgi:competence protein ComEA